MINKTLEKLFKILKSDNAAEFLEESENRQIVENVINGYKIDERSREEWLDINHQAMELVKCQDMVNKNFPFQGASQVIYPLIIPATIQLAARLSQHLIRNGEVGSCAILGKDPDGRKQDLAERVSKYLNYCYLMESDYWVSDSYKMQNIVASWGVAFTKTYYDPNSKKICDEFIHPEDVIINNDTQNLEKARRITIRHAMTKNDLIERMRAGQFIEIDSDDLDKFSSNNNEIHKNDSAEINPVHEIFEQFCYLDLDEDGYEEPYIVFVHHRGNKLLGIYPAFELNDIEINEEGKILKIIPRIYITDQHAIRDPEGKYYSLGVNHLLFHQSKSITSILRQLIDAGTLANASAVTGFVSQGFKTKERDIKIKLGSFQTVETNPNIDMNKQIMNLPFREPSQTLLALLQVLIEAGKETGFITDTLTGDTEMQNVPATTALAAIEQATRAFKPMIQNLFCAQKRRFKLWFHLNSLYLDENKYFRFNKSEQNISKFDFDESSLDICPVADPTQSNEASKFARLRAAMEFAQVLPGTVNAQQLAYSFFDGLEFPNAEKFVTPPAPPPPDPKMVEIQARAEMHDKDLTIKNLLAQVSQYKAETERLKIAQKAREVNIKEDETREKQARLIADAAYKMDSAKAKKDEVKIKEYDAVTKRIEATKPPKD